MEKWKLVLKNVLWLFVFFVVVPLVVMGQTGSSCECSQDADLDAAARGDCTGAKSKDKCCTKNLCAKGCTTNEKVCSAEPPCPSCFDVWGYKHSKICTKATDLCINACLHCGGDASRKKVP